MVGKKIGPNERCPCLSGKKYKKCCGSPAAIPPLIDPVLKQAVSQKIREVEALRLQRQAQQGLGRQILSAQLKGERIVFVGNRPYHSAKWKTFQDFLRDYLVAQLGHNWFTAEIAKAPGTQHPIAGWYVQSVEDVKRLGTKVGDVVSGPMTGAQRAFINLAYNLYLIAHHARPGKDDALLQTFVRRLKSNRTDDFIGKLFETYAAAAFLKAGFEVEYENEKDGQTSHVEFVATYPATARKFSVEVKARNRSPAADGPVDEIKRLRIGNKLNQALSKEAKYERVVMIEINIPDVLTEVSLSGWPREALDQIRYVEKLAAPDGGPKPSGYVFVTNHAFHNNLTAVDFGVQALAASCRKPGFAPDYIFSGLKEFLEHREAHVEMLALIASMKKHYEIPSTFDGEIPELAFDNLNPLPRIKIGSWYRVPGPDGEEVEAVVVEAVVVEKQKAAHCIVRDRRNRGFHVTMPMTDAELAAWRKHPSTYFGVIRHAAEKANHPLELGERLFDVYKNTERKKLLELMKEARDIAQLRELSQRDLAIAYCERAAWAAFPDFVRAPP